MKYFSTFSGIGGFELGITQAYENKRLGKQVGQDDTVSGRQETLDSTRVGNSQTRRNTDDTEYRTQATCVGYSEIDKYASQIYQSHFPNHKNYGDITSIIAKDLPDFDLLVGGFPCQSFSIAGKRGGFNDTRGTMFFELARILRAKQPRLFVFENVKGLLSHDGGRTFATIIQTLDELGYDCQWQVLNSKNHGVPQNRERVFIIGHLRGTSRPEVFPFGESDGNPIQGSSKRENSATIDTKGGTNARGTFIKRLNDPKMARNRVYGDTGISPTLQTGTDRVVNGEKIRRLTPTECERLQGFPVGWTDGVSDTQRYKTLGNAVTVNVIEDIFTKILFGDN